MKWIFYRDELEAVLVKVLPREKYIVTRDGDYIIVQDYIDKKPFAPKLIAVKVFFERILKYNVNITPWRVISTDKEDLEYIPEKILKQITK